MLDANIEHLQLAIDGRVDFAMKTNPFGSGEEPKQETSDPQVAMDQLKGFVARQQEAHWRKGKGRK